MKEMANMTRMIGRKSPVPFSLALLANSSVVKTREPSICCAIDAIVASVASRSKETRKKFTVSGIPKRRRKSSWETNEN